MKLRYVRLLVFTEDLLCARPSEEAAEETEQYNEARQRWSVALNIDRNATLGTRLAPDSGLLTGTSLSVTVRL